LLALGAALGLVQLLEALDTRIRSRDDILALLSVPPLAVIPWLARAKS
jgi:capsular polysaccharide biosynthesis protein